MPECEQCGKEFDSERGLNVHKGQVHAGEDGDSGTDAGSEGFLTVEISRTQTMAGAFVLGLVVMGALIFAVDTTGVLAPGGDDGDARVELSESFIDGEPTLGTEDANVTIIELSDFGCPWCAEWAGVDAFPQRPIDQEESLSQIQSNYIDTGDVRFVYKDYPVQRLHPNAPQAHVAANCVLEQSSDLYWDFHDELFERRGQWTANGQGDTDATFSQIAEDIGADAQAMESCIAAADGSEVQQDIQEIQDQVGNIGTPSFLIGSFEDGFTLVEGAQPYSMMQPVIDSELSG